MNIEFFPLHSLIIFAFSLSILTSAYPQIFNDKYTFCDFNFRGKIFVFPNKVWTINKPGFTIYFSICKSKHNLCQNKTTSCMILKNTEFRNLGDEFTQRTSNDFILKSMNGDRCPSNPSKNYSLLISFHCSELMSPQPRLMFFNEEDECSFEISMMSPDCQPKCTQLIENSYLLNINNFSENIDIQSDTKKFSINLCGSNPRCSEGIAACEILNNSVTAPLATIESQHLNYDISKNELTARGRYKLEKITKELQVLIKCNWEVDSANAKYKNVPKQGKRYRFELESSVGCVKLPQSCTLTSLDNTVYNLEKLNREEGWEVSNIPQGRMTVNICGPLRRLNNTCADQYSQACHVENNIYKNMGSILSQLKSDDEVIYARFVSGSTCLENPQFLYSTEVKFICAKTEEGPIFKEHTECVVHLIWKTPHACPINYYKSSNCYMNDRISNRNLKTLHSIKDKRYLLSPNNSDQIIYNLCGALHTSCNNYTNVSFCLKTEQREAVIGWENSELISDNGLLRLELVGAECSNAREGKVNINFICTYENPAPAPQIIVIEDSCRYNLTVFTHLACLTQADFVDCVYNTDNLTYNLSPLVYRNKNHVIQSDNVDYIFNLCGPVISGHGSLCHGNTMFCLRNKTEANINKQYTSLGGVGKPRLYNNKLVVEAEMGAFCRESGHYKSVINFECSKEKFAPTFLNQDRCVYFFEWKTPEACPLEKSCIVNSTDPNITLDLTYLQKKKVKFNVNTNEYDFHLCRDVYYFKRMNGSNNIKSLKRYFYTFEQNSYLVLNLQNSCVNNNTIDKVIFKIQCSQTIDDYFKESSFENCVLNMTIHTKIVCTTNEVIPPIHPIIKPTKLHKYEKETDLITSVHRNFEKNCTITNANTGVEFNLIKLQSEELFFNKSSFILNFDQTSLKCNSLFCRNNTKLIPQICPIVFFNYSNHLVKLDYHSSGKICNSTAFYTLEILLHCSETGSNGKIAMNENCKTVVEYNMPDVCYLLSDNTPSSKHTTAIVSSVISIFIMVVLVCLIYFNRRRCSIIRNNYFITNKSCVPLYTKDCSL